MPEMVVAATIIDSFFPYSIVSIVTGISSLAGPRRRIWEGHLSEAIASAASSRRLACLPSRQVAGLQASTRIC